MAVFAGMADVGNAGGAGAVTVKEPGAEELAQEVVKRKRTKATVKEMMAIAKRAYHDHGDLIYDGYGLPK